MNQSQAERVVSCVGNLIVAGKDGSPIEDWNHARRRFIEALTTEAPAPATAADAEAVRLLRGVVGAFDSAWSVGDWLVNHKNSIDAARTYLSTFDGDQKEPSNG